MGSSTWSNGDLRTWHGCGAVLSRVRCVVMPPLCVPLTWEPAVGWGRVELGWGEKRHSQEWLVSVCKNACVCSFPGFLTYPLPSFPSLSPWPSNSHFLPPLFSSSASHFYSSLLSLTYWVFLILGKQLYGDILLLLLYTKEQQRGEYRGGKHVQELWLVA